MTTQLTVQKTNNEVYIPTANDWRFMVDWAAEAIKSGMLPSSIKNPQAAAIVILKGRELGLTFMTSLSHVHVINGRPTMSAELIQSLARKNLPGLVINILESSNTLASVEFIRPEKGSKPYIQKFSWDDAVKADLANKQVWKQYPAAMLWSRAVTAGLRKICPEALSGVSYTPEEMGANVDSDGNVIETSGRAINDNQAETHPTPPEKPKVVVAPVSNANSTALSEEARLRKVELSIIGMLRAELGISQEELKAEVFKLCGTDDSTKLSLKQLKDVTALLEKEKLSRADEKTVDADNEEVDPNWFSNMSENLPPAKL